ncbi:MAG: phospholipase D-like domain-containing protein [Rhodobacter sp.]|nr:phospholipase D-like domain-containing protein [Rhodobacter sp.]
MRVEKNGISVHAIAGNRTVLFGMDADADARRGLLGFAFGRKTDDRVRWMRGFKFFEATAADPRPGERRTTEDHPIQSFQWGDYSVDPGSRRDYVVKAVYGTPTALTYGPDIDIAATTYNAPSDSHQVYFNRGAIPSQAFADRFGNAGPTVEETADPDNAKTAWLSRGLLEAALAYIGQARGPAFELRVAAYEFYYKPILLALKRAAQRGAVVRISFDGGDQRRDGTIRASSISTENLAKIAEYGLDAEPTLSLHPRTMFSKIPHNKFIVLLRNGVPEQVWTGSTNFTPSGFLGQSNVGHVVREPSAAAAYNTYWEAISKDPATRGFKDFNTAIFPGPVGDIPPDSLVPVFSPRRRGMLEWYAGMLEQAAESAMFTAAFGVARPLAEKFAADRDFLRFLLMERRDRNPETMELLERDRDTRIALGSGLNSWAIRLKLDGHALDAWFKAEEHFRTQGHIFYIHTKYMLLDALSDDPKLFTGSANFSAPSVEGNDENMILMRGPAFKRVAEVYATEFMRLFNHLYFRTVVLRRARAGIGAQKGVAMLDPTDGWVARHFRTGSYHDRKRKLFR